MNINNCRVEWKSEEEWIIIDSFWDFYESLNKNKIVVNEMSVNDNEWKECEMKQHN